MLEIKIGGKKLDNKHPTVTISQHVGQHHGVSITIPLEDKDAAFKKVLETYTKDYIGKKLEIAFKDNHFIGVVDKVSFGRASGNSLILHASSPTIFMDDTPHTRSYYKKAFEKIIKDTSKDYTNAIDIKIKPRFQGNIHYTVQYKESNFSYLRRMATRYGEWFFYDGETLFLGKPTSKTIKLDFGIDLKNFAFLIKALPAEFELAAYDYKKNKSINATSKHKKHTNAYLKAALENSKADIYKGKAKYPLNLSMNEDDLKQRLEIHQNATISEVVTITGSSTVSELRLGSVIHVVDDRFLLEGGFDDYGKYIIISITHDISPEGDYYTNHFEAIPEEVVSPPLSASSEGQFCETQHAVVTDINDPDGLGRVMVQFDWQKETNQKSPWIRVASPYTGNDKGFYLIPEKGDQVLIAFERNNPESPFVLTGMYHSDTKPMYFHKENDKKGLKTRGGNEILIIDEKGKESINITSPCDITVTGTNGKVTITADGEILIESKDKDITIKTPKNISLEADNININAKSDLTLTARKIKAAARSSFDAKAINMSLVADLSHSIKGTDVSVEGSANVKVDGTASTIINGGIIKLN